MPCPHFLPNPVTTRGFSLLLFICKHQVDVQPLKSLNHNVEGFCVTNDGSQNEGTTGSLSSLFLIPVQLKCVPVNTTAHSHLLRELLSSPVTLPLHTHVLTCGLHTPESRNCWILIPSKFSDGLNLKSLTLLLNAVVSNTRTGYIDLQLK